LHLRLLAVVTTASKDGSWRYSEGATVSPFLLGEIEEGAHVHCFESPWDAIAFADSSGERNNIISSRGFKR